MKNFLYVLFLFFSASAFGQESGSVEAKNKNPFPVKYTSATDQKLNIRTLTLAPVYDNVNGIYSVPIEKLLIELLQNDKVWGYSPFPSLTKKLFVETFDTNPNEVLEILDKTTSQGLLTALITKGPNGLSAKLRLYTADQGMLLAEESFQDSTAFELPKLREEFVRLYQNIKNRLPYRAIVLSRRGLEVTINAGAKNGLSTGQELSIAQILKVNRHPKLKYMVGHEKEITGRIQITKVEPYLSFAQIIFEKETGVIDVGAKIIPSDYIAYPMPVINSSGEVIDDKVMIAGASGNTSKDSAVESPKFGKVLFQGGFTQYSESAQLVSGTTIEAAQSVAPTFTVSGEFWFTKNWFVEFSLLQSFFKIENRLVGSSPTALNYTLAKYAGTVGYYFLLNDSFWGPKISTQFGFVSNKTDVTDSNPTFFTSTSSGGMQFKLSGSTPIDEEFPVELGASFNLVMNPVFSESPVNSGDAKPRINTFGVFGTYQDSPNLRYRVDFTFEQITADFSGAGTRSNPARSTTQVINSQLFGIEYLF